MTLTIRSDASGGAILADGVEKIIFDSVGNVTFGITGEFKFLLRATAPAGWVVPNGTTIGSPSSGAGRANNDTQALFNAWWADYSDAQCPMLTSAGGVSTRGASSTNDWAAGKRLTLIDMTGRFPRAAGSLNGTVTVNGTAYADRTRAHTHPITPMVALPGTGGTSGYTYNQVNTASPIGAGVTQQNGTELETSPYSMGMLPVVKL